MALRLSLTPDKVRVQRGQAVVAESYPYVRLKKDDGPPIYIQNGHYFFEGGPEVKPDQFPDWIEEEVNKLNHDTRVAVGLEVETSDKKRK